MALALESRVGGWEAARGRCALGVLAAPSSPEGSPREGSSPPRPHICWLTYRAPGAAPSSAEKGELCRSSPEALITAAPLKGLEGHSRGTAGGLLCPSFCSWVQIPSPPTEAPENQPSAPKPSPRADLSAQPARNFETHDSILIPFEMKQKKSNFEAENDVLIYNISICIVIQQSRGICFLIFVFNGGRGLLSP